MSESSLLWDHIFCHLESILPDQDINTYIRSLRIDESDNTLTLFAPNIFIRNWLVDNLSEVLNQLILEVSPENPPKVVISQDNTQVVAASNNKNTNGLSFNHNKPMPEGPGLNNTVDGVGYNFQNFVEGNSNELGLAAAIQVSENPGEKYNPLYLYGASGLGKTHLMYAIRNAIKEKQPNARIALINTNEYLHHMVDAIRAGTINEFKRFYETLDVLLMDDVHFLAEKQRTQEEFFHTFNTLTSKGRQIVLTCDRYPEEIQGLESRLQSRFGSGLPIQINPPELETRVSILMDKAKRKNHDLPEDTAFFIAKHVQSNVRALEGVLARVLAHADLKKSSPDIHIAKEALRDVVQLRERRVSMDNIMIEVAKYFSISVADLQSKSRRREVARPRQMAMALTKELTTHSLPDIGKAFGGRDHTTVLHACRAIEKLRKENETIDGDYFALIRLLRG